MVVGCDGVFVTFSKLITAIVVVFVPLDLWWKISVGVLLVFRFRLDFA
jgi:hypothetical protein